MRAAVIATLGAPPSVGDVPAPEPAEGELLVDVLASALNPIDIAVGSGRFFAGHPPLPYVPGAEAVGRVVRGHGFPAGALVYLSGVGFGTARDGGLAERAAAPSDAAVALPDGADPGVAAAVGIAGLAGWLPLAWRAPVRAEDRVLVLGATGVAGRIALQAARLLGAARVVAAGRRATALADALELGADAAVELDGPPEQLAERFRAACGGDGPTYVYDPLWGLPATAAVLAAAPGARIVNLGQSAGADATLPSGAVRGKQLELYGYLNFAVPAAVRAQAHADLLAHVAAGRLHVALERVALEDVAEAWTRQASGGDSKLVVEPRT
jgi:NADPH2:quinone reductase